MKKKLLTLALAVALSLSTFTIGALAASGKQTIEVNYKDIKLVVDGIEVELKDGAGNSVEPFIYNGSTYAPFRAIAEALGKEVAWDGDTSTIYVGKIPGAEKNWMTELPPYQTDRATVYDGTDRDKFFEVAGLKQTQGVVFSKRSNTGERPFAIWNTNGAYSTMTLTVGHMGDRTNNAKIEVYLDGEYSTEYEFTWDGAPKTISIPIKSAPNVKLQFVYGDPSREGLAAFDVGSEYVSDGQYGIYDISFS